MARSDSFTKRWASVPSQFERPTDALIDRGWAGGAAEDPPEAKWENWWHNRVDEALAEIEQNGAMQWFGDAPYKTGARVRNGDKNWIAAIANTGVEPGGAYDAGHWVEDRVIASGVILSIAASTVLTSAQMGLLLADASGAALTATLPYSDALLGVRDIIIRRTDNTGNRLKIQAAGTDKIKFHTHLASEGYPFTVLMGAGDWWHLRSDGQGSWWPIGRHDTTPLGRPVFETTTVFAPGGYGALSGSELIRADWPWLWDHAQQSGMLTTEAARVGMEGGWTSGDGVATFRGPEGRGEFLRVLDDGRGIDTGRAGGSRQADSLRATVNVGQISQSQYSWPNGTSHGLGYLKANEGLAVIASGSETRPLNIAYPGRIKLI
ncbi:hypothetical protein B382_25497 [Stutzerimonas stutzeri B1SMN1]|nr:hypothetical protein B382_25497 [Stutzerimonas stutzeri B1SMN1]